MSFCFPVKKGWQLEQISRRSSWPFVDLVVQVAPQAQWTLTTLYSGWIPGFMALQGAAGDDRHKHLILPDGPAAHNARPRSRSPIGGVKYLQNKAARHSTAAWKA